MDNKAVISNMAWFASFCTWQSIQNQVSPDFRPNAFRAIFKMPCTVSKHSLVVHKLNIYRHKSPNGSPFWTVVMGLKRFVVSKQNVQTLELLYGPSIQVFFNHYLPK